MITASIGDPWLSDPDRTDERRRVTVTVTVDVLPEYAEKVLVALVREARSQALNAVEPPF